MKTHSAAIIILIFIGGHGCGNNAPESIPPPVMQTDNLPYSGETVYQTSPYSAMLDEVYDGSMTVGELKRLGDTAIGTFDALDGELVMVDGVCYQLTADGVLSPAPDDLTTPFAMTTAFDTDMNVPIQSPMDYAGLTALLDSLRASDNILYAVRLEGTFSRLRTKSVPAQTKPYPPLADILDTQPEFEFTDVSGTMVGFWCPAYLEDVNVPGYHMHVVTGDLRSGGHVIDCMITSGTVSLDPSPGFAMFPADTAEYLQADLTRTIRETIGGTGQYRHYDEE